MSEETITDSLAPEQVAAEGLSGQRAYLAQRDVHLARRMMAHLRRMWGVKAVHRRRREIAARRHKLWHGRLVFRFICTGCEKERWEPEFVAWGLISLKRYRCAWCLVKGEPRRDPNQTTLFAEGGRRWKLRKRCSG